MPTVKDIIVRKPTAEEIEKCKKWPIWTCGISKFDWEYTQTETCLILEGRVTITDDPDSGNSASFAPGDLVILPDKLKCFWEVKEPVKKHYHFD